MEMLLVSVTAIVADEEELDVDGSSVAVGVADGGDALADGGFDA